MSIFKRLGKNNSKGFTLIELLVVIAIIGILATLLLVQLGTARARARDAQRVSNVAQIRTAVELFNGENARYPVGCTAVVAVSCPIIVNTPPAMGAVAESIQPFLSSTVLPSDPLTAGVMYSYSWNLAVPTKFQIVGQLETAGHVGLRSDADINTLAGGTWTAVGLGTPINGVTETCATQPACNYDLGQP